MRKCYMLETGVLLNEKDEEFEKYSQVYDKNHGYYDEYQGYVLDLDEAKKQADAYVKEGNATTYAIVCETTIADDIPDEAVGLLPVENVNYTLDNVVYAIHNSNGTVEPLF